MTISDVLSIAQSGLQTAQAQIRVASDNITNVNTPGYARKIVNQTEVVAGGVGLGVRIAGIQRAADSFLQQASLSATSQSSQADTLSTYLDQAQKLLGDPSTTTSFFSGLDKVYSTFSTAADQPATSLTRSNALGAVSDFIQNACQISSSIKGLQGEANQAINSNVSVVNDLLTQISANNGAIAQATVTGADAAGSQDLQSQLIDKLSGLLQVQVQPNATGGVTIRSSDGVFLAGDRGAATVAYSTVGGAGILTVTPPKGVAQNIQAGGGQIGGLLQLSQVQLPQIAGQLGEFVTQAVNQLNAAHNASTAIPPPASLTGRNVGMDLPTALNGFTGKTTIAITDATGVMQKRVDIDFTAKTMAVNGAAASSYGSNANFAAALNGALGASGSVSFANGALTLSAASGGVSIGDDPATPSQKNSQGFSQFFGLNNLIQSAANTQYATGLSAGDPNTFNSGGVLTLQLANASGAALRQVSFTVPAGGTVQTLLDGLNTSVGNSGAFALDSRGELSFTPTGTTGTTVSVISDTTVNAQGGASMSALFGVGNAMRASRAGSFTLRPDIAVDSSKLAFAHLDLTAAVGGQPALAPGDGNGALGLAQAGEQVTQFSASGDLKALQLSVSGYASEFAGHVGAKASNADNTKQTADAMASQATTQRSGVEGVSLDQELVNLQTYQQSYSACARLVQASKDMFDTLLNIA